MKDKLEKLELLFEGTGICRDCGEYECHTCHDCEECYCTCTCPASETEARLLICTSCIEYDNEGCGYCLDCCECEPEIKIEIEV